MNEKKLIIRGALILISVMGVIAYLVFKEYLFQIN